MAWQSDMVDYITGYKSTYDSDRRPFHLVVKQTGHKRYYWEVSEQLPEKVDGKWWKDVASGHTESYPTAKQAALRATPRNPQRPGARR